MARGKKTRDKVRYQAYEAERDLKSAMNHLAQLGGLAAERSDYISGNLPELVAALELLIETLEKFNEGL
jgi:hypothetical protein